MKKVKIIFVVMQEKAYGRRIYIYERGMMPMASDASY